MEGSMEGSWNIRWNVRCGVSMGPRYRCQIVDGRLSRHRCQASSPASTYVSRHVYGHAGICRCMCTDTCRACVKTYLLEVARHGDDVAQKYLRESVFFLHHVDPFKSSPPQPRRTVYTRTVCKHTHSFMSSTYFFSVSRSSFSASTANTI